MRKVLAFVAMALLVASCGRKEVQLIDAANFNKEVDGKQVSLYTMHNGDVTMQVTNYGARVVALWTPDRKGNFEDITLGYDHIDKYLDNHGERYLGAVVGRCANRIADGSFTLNDSVYQLVKNDGNNTLHGGRLGTDRVVWDVLNANDSALVMHVVLPDGQDGFPGNLDITVTYTLTKQNEFRINYKATTDKPTLCNLSNHTFFNLKGEGKDVLGEQLEINGNWILPVDENLIPAGTFMSVNNTLFDPENRREVEVYTDQLGLQFYSGNFFDGKAQGKWGPHVYRGAIALETQNFPDAINQDNLVIKPVLNPGEEYTQTCIYKFSVGKRRK